MSVRLNKFPGNFMFFSIFLLSIVFTMFKQIFLAMGQCPPLGSLLNVVPSVLWTATNPDVNMNLSVGSTFNFFCPTDLQVSVLYKCFI